LYLLGRERSCVCVCGAVWSHNKSAPQESSGRQRKIRQRQTDCEIRDEVLAFFAGLYQMSVTRTGAFKLVPLFDLCEINVGLLYATKSRSNNKMRTIARAAF
jgi:hypothetical protein